MNPFSSRSQNESPTPGQPVLGTFVARDGMPQDGIALDRLSRDPAPHDAGVDGQLPSAAPERPRGSVLAQAVIARQFATLWHPLLSGLAGAEDCEAAAKCLVAHFAEIMPDHTVRFGWGTKIDGGSEKRCRRLTRLIDSRLGWLGADNSIFDRLKTRFETTSPDSDEKEPIRWEAGNLVFDLSPVAVSGDRGTSRAALDCGRLWIRPPEDHSEELQRFAAMVPVEVLQTIAAVFFSRPANTRLARIASVMSRWWSRRGTIGIAVLLLILIACIPVSYRINATATVTAMDARRVAAPIDATLLVAHVQPGDHVAAGEPLLELDGRPLRIELEAISGEIAEATKDEDIALASGQIAQAQLAGLKRQTLSRRRDLIASRLDQLVVTSPIDGIVIQGDLHHSLGMPVELGQTLLEIAPLGSVEIELEIPEVEIGYVHPATPVQLWFPAVGRDTFHSQIKMVWPSATIRDDKNVFVAKTPMPTSGTAMSAQSARQLVTQTAMQSTGSFVLSEATQRDPVATAPNSDHAARLVSDRLVSDRLVSDRLVSDRSGSDESTFAERSLRVGMRGEAVVFGPTRPWIWKWVRLPLRRVGWLIGW